MVIYSFEYVSTARSCAHSCKPTFARPCMNNARAERKADLAMKNFSVTLLYVFPRVN